MTLKLVVELSNYKVTECGFDYVLIAKLNQGHFKCFFFYSANWRSKQIPYIPYILKVYRMLFICTLLKPPKFWNCTVSAK